jgi:hypothetical protein
MRHLFAVASLLSIILATPSFASLQIVGGNSIVGIPVPGNDFAGPGKPLTLLGLTHLVVGDVSVTGPGYFSFFVHGSESGYRNSFAVDGLPTFQEPEFSDIPWDGLGYHIGDLPILAAGTTLLSSLNAIFTGGDAAPITDPEFGIFISSATVDPSGYDRLYFGYDDNGANKDDNHDDLIVSVTFTADPGTNPPPGLPEPFSGLVWCGLAAAAVLAPGFARRRS